MKQVIKFIQGDYTSAVKVLPDGPNELPDSLYINGGLDVCGCNVTHLPRNLHVVRWCDLEDSMLRCLHGGIIIEGSLWLEGCDVTTLPDGLIIRGVLVLGDVRCVVVPVGVKKHY